MAVETESIRALASTPSSTTSGCLSGDEASEDHFLPSNLAHEELQLALNKEATEQELLKAITRCKDLVLESDQCSPERKWLVRHLIELRLRLQECREAMADPENWKPATKYFTTISKKSRFTFRHPRNKSSGVSKRTVCGHHLQLQPLLRNTHFRHCDHCTDTIWCVVQAWYQCEDCKYVCHYKCLSSIVRECAHVTASEKGGYELDICPEFGLSSQEYECAECHTKFSITARGISCFGQLLLGDAQWTDARICDYTGKYYCTACHWNSAAIIPARVIHNWDFALHPVCQASLQLLKITANRPLINLEKLNSRLFSLIHELSVVRDLRKELNIIRKYLTVCRKANEDHLLWKGVEYPYWIELPDLYSLQDLIDTQSGELPCTLQTVVDNLKKHIKEDCEICKGHGHICEICSNDNVLFPFDSIAVICEQCKAVLHKLCLEKRKVCPKCVRLQARKEQEKPEDHDD